MTDRLFSVIPLLLLLFSSAVFSQESIILSQESITRGRLLDLSILPQSTTLRESMKQLEYLIQAQETLMSELLNKSEQEMLQYETLLTQCQLGLNSMRRELTSYQEKSERLKNELEVMTMKNRNLKIVLSVGLPVLTVSAVLALLVH